MAKGYWIARVDIRDPERYKDYVTAATPAFEKYGATFLARAGSSIGSKVPLVPATSSSNSPRCRRPSTVTIRPNTRLPRPSARKSPMPKWSS